MLAELISSPEFVTLRSQINVSNIVSQFREFVNRRRIIGEVTLFPVMDYTPIAQLYHQQIIRKNNLVHGLSENPKEVILSDGWLHLISKDIEKGGDRLIEGLFKNPEVIKETKRREKTLKSKLTTSLDSPPSQLTPPEFSEVFNQMTSYGSLLLDSYIIRDFLPFIAKRVPRLSDSEREALPFQFLYPSSEVPYFFVFDSQVLKLVQENLHLGLSDSSLRYFIENFGYLGRTDFVPDRCEDKDYVTNLVNERSNWLQTPEKAEEARSDIVRWRVCSTNSRYSAHRKLIRAYKRGSSDRKEIERYLSFIDLSLCFNESNRKIRSRFFKFGQEWMESHGLNVRTDSPPEQCYELPSKESVGRCFN